MRKGRKIKLIFISAIFILVMLRSINLYAREIRLGRREK